MNVLIAESEHYAPRALQAMRDRGWSVKMYTAALDRLPDELTGVDGVITRFGLRWTEEVLDRAGALRFLAVPATGTDHVDLRAAARRGIDVVSLAGHPGLASITATPEHAFGLMLALLRNTIPAHRSVRRGEWDRAAYMGHQLKGSTVGVIGLGRTGTAFARMADAFGARVCYYDPHVDDTTWTRCATLDELARGCDVVALHAVLNAETEGLLGESFFRALKPGAFLVNTARGALIDETALLAALTSGRLAGAALDVIRHEPEGGFPVESPLVEYARRHDHLVLTPHIGGATHESICAAEELLVEVLITRYADPAP